MILETLRQRRNAMNIHEVAKIFGLSESLLYRMAAERQIPSVRLAGALRFDPSDLADWYASRLNPGKKRPVASERNIPASEKIAG
jgi:excisionase family DNA binding protein